MAVDSLELAGNEFLDESLELQDNFKSKKKKRSKLNIGIGSYAMGVAASLGCLTSQSESQEKQVIGAATTALLIGVSTLLFTSEEEINSDTNTEFTQIEILQNDTNKV